MRQRNDTGYPLTVAADPPFEVPAGETIEHPDRVAGLTQLDRPEDVPGKYDPAQHTVDEVRDFLGRDDVDLAEARRVFTAEVKGENRTTLLEHRDAVLAAKKAAAERPASTPQEQQ
jgi:hypothetical protein